jgi:diaminopimelate epimerase
VNVEFVQVLGPDRLRMRVWERGSGVTLACGTGACASTAAAAARGLAVSGEPVSVELDGGTLTVTVLPDGRVSMSGPAEFVYEGDTELC